jgi:hypothetical protein
MERRIQTVIFFIFLFYSALFAQEVSQKQQIRIQLWAELEAYPGLVVSGSQQDIVDSEQTQEQKQPDEKEIFNVAITRLKEIGPFIAGGMINGWKFDYVPENKLRSIKESFTCEPAMSFDKKMNPLVYHKPEVMDERLYCWLCCDRTPSQQLSFESWSSVTHPKIHGIGQGPVEDGFDGIKTACENAVKNAVREYWRTILKNKPKEITGTVLLIHNPRIYIKEGRYTVDLDFFMETGKIIPYSFY